MSSLPETREAREARRREASKKFALFGSPTFRCPNCTAFAQHSWYGGMAEYMPTPPAYPTGALSIGRMQEALPAFLYSTTGLHLSICQACRSPAIWREGLCIWPRAVPNVPAPTDDMPDEVKKDYIEASEVLEKSPRAAAAILRLAVEKLCRHLGKSGTIDRMIGDLVKDGLPIRVQRALDVVRVVGNEAVHPGSLDLRDDRETATSLFQLVIFIVDRMITEEKTIDELYNNLPAGKLEGIEQRDAPAAKNMPKPSPPKAVPPAPTVSGKGASQSE